MSANSSTAQSNRVRQKCNWVSHTPWAHLNTVLAASRSSFAGTDISLAPRGTSGEGWERGGWRAASRTVGNRTGREPAPFFRSPPPHEPPLLGSTPAPGVAGRALAASGTRAVLARTFEPFRCVRVFREARKTAPGGGRAPQDHPIAAQLSTFRQNRFRGSMRELF